MDDKRSSKIRFMNLPKTGLEPVQLIQPRDFKSLVSTDSTTSAQCNSSGQSLIRQLKHKDSQYFLSIFVNKQEQDAIHTNRLYRHRC